MSRLILTHNKNDGARIEGRGLTLDLIILESSPEKVELEITGLSEQRHITLSLEQPEVEIVSGLRIKWNDYYHGRVRLTYDAEPAYRIKGRNKYDGCKVLVLAHKQGEGVRIFRDGSKLDLIVKVVNTSPRSGEVELRDGERLVQSFHMEPEMEPLTLLDGFSVRVGLKQKGGTLRIVYMIRPGYGLKKMRYDYA